MRMSKEEDRIRSLIEGCLQHSKTRWKNIEHATGWTRQTIFRYFPDLHAKAKAICKENRDDGLKSDFSAAEDHVRHAVEQLLASGTQPSIQNVHRAVPKGPYLSERGVESILRKMRQEELPATAKAAA